MNNIRVFLWLTLLGMAYLTYTAWVADYRARPAVGAPTGDTPPSQGPADSSNGALPSLEQNTSQTAPPTPTSTASPPGELIRVRTDVLDVLISSQGGDLVRADLPQYPVEK